MGRNEHCFEKCKKNIQGRQLKVQLSQQEEPYSSMKPTDNANKTKDSIVAIFTALLKNLWN